MDKSRAGRVPLSRLFVANDFNWQPKHNVDGLCSIVIFLLETCTIQSELHDGYLQLYHDHVRLPHLLRKPL